MAKRYKKNNAGLRILCVVLALMLAAACTLGGLELWGTGKMKPSEWFKQDDLAPVTISLADDAAPIGAAKTFENGARAYALSTTGYVGYPSTKRATATCTLPEGGNPDRYEWQITGGEGLSVKTVNSDGSAADVTAQTYFSGSATLTARAYLGSELRGIGSVRIYTNEPEPEPEPEPQNFIALIELQSYAEENEYMQDITTFKSEVLPVLDAEVKEYPVETTEDLETKVFDALSYSPNVIIFFDRRGELAELAENGTIFDGLYGTPFIFIDDMPYSAEAVEAAGGVYFTAGEYDTDDARSALDELGSYGQALYYKEGETQTAFDHLRENLFGDAQEFHDESECANSASTWGGDVIIFLPNAEKLSDYITALDDPAAATWIIGNYAPGEASADAAEMFCNLYGYDIEKFIVFQKQMNTQLFAEMLINFFLGGNMLQSTEIYTYTRILPQP